MSKPLEDMLVVDFSQFLSGPSAGLRLADLGARVIKVERSGTGDICRQLYISNLVMNGDSSVFHAINRNKESFAADLKQEEDRRQVISLLRRADVLIHNFRPGVMERLGLDYEFVKTVKPDIIYAEITGYGKEGVWKDKPGQDLLVQSLSGLAWLSGSKKDMPVPMGIAVADILTGAHLVQGILACLVRKGVTGQGGNVQVSMLESIVDFQFETITTWYHDGGQPVTRAESSSAHAYVGAPYGVYRTKDGFLALAMASVPELGKLTGCTELQNYPDPATWSMQRDEIMRILAEHLLTGTTEAWLKVLEPADIWCAEVLTWDKLMAHEGFRVLDMIQDVRMSDGFHYRTTRCPILIDGAPLFSEKGSPKLGEHTAAIIREINGRN